MLLWIKSKKNKKNKKRKNFHKGAKMKKTEENRFIVSVRVGPKGQITIPVEARKMFSIQEGETLMVLGDKSRGIAIMKTDAFYALMGEQNDGNSN